MIIIRKKTLICTLSIFLLLFSACIIIACAAGFSKKECIIIDAGHGEPDGGAVGVTGVLEKDINLAISLKLQEVLTAKGYDVVMTREADSAIYSPESETIREKKKSDMNERLNIMKNSNADLFLSIHMNSFEVKSAEGLNIFYSANYPEIKNLAECIQTRMSELTGALTHNIKEADKSLFLMKNPPLPVILAECGFLSNPEEEKKLNNAEYQAKLAWAIADAIDDYYSDN